MYRQLQLPTRDTTLNVQPAPVRNQMPLMRLILGLVFCATLAILLLQKGALLSPGKQMDKRPASPASPALSASRVEDLLRHLEDAVTNQAKSTAELKRSREWIVRTLSGIDDDYMRIERRRLSVAITAIDAAQQAIARAREDVELTKNLLNERTNVNDQ